MYAFMNAKIVDFYVGHVLIGEISVLRFISPQIYNSSKNKCFSSF